MADQVSVDSDKQVAATTWQRKYDPGFGRNDDEDELPPGYVNPLSQTSGTDKDITPAKSTDDGWDPRQW